MKTSILILLLSFLTNLSYSNGESSGRSSIKDVSANSKNNFEAPEAEDSTRKENNTICTKNNSSLLSFHTIKSLLFKKKCDKPTDQKSPSKNQKLFFKILKILLVALSIGLVALLVSMASVSMLLFVIPL